MENVWFFFKDNFDVYSDQIKIGVPLQKHSLDLKLLKQLIGVYSYDNKCEYILSLDHRNRIQISLNKESNCETVL